MIKLDAAEADICRIQFENNQGKGIIMEMETHIHTFDPKAPYAPTYTGTFERTIQIGNKQRRFLLYLPEELRASAPGVFVLGENGKTVEDILRESLWRVMADTSTNVDKMVLVILEPENGAWKVDEPYGCPDGDVAYVNGIWQYFGGLDIASIHQSRFYVWGCREGGTMAHMAVMANPANYAGLVSVGAGDVPESYLRQVQTAPCEDLHFVSVPEWQICKGSVGVPTWIIHDPNVPSGVSETMEAYWRHACETDDRPVQLRPDVTAYFRSAPTLYPMDDQPEAHCVYVSTIPGASARQGYQILPRSWNDFLLCHRRWAGNPLGDLQLERNPVDDLGMEYHYEEIGGFMREWYVYVPQSVRKQPERPAPLVLALHGFQCSGAIYAGDSGWYRVAEKYGFIVVLPSAVNGMIYVDTIGAGKPGQTLQPAWNFLQEPGKPNELEFFKTLLKKISRDHAIDPGRIYATGHSHGSMMSHTLAMSMPEVFAAIAPCSGVMLNLGGGPSILDLPEVKARRSSMVPCWMFAGDSEEILMPAIPTEDNMTGHTISEWCSRNGLAQVKDWKSGWQLHQNRWHDLVLRNSAGVPMVRYTWIEHFPHVVTSEQSFRIWEEFFAKFSRRDGAVCYDGEAGS